MDSGTSKTRGFIAILPGTQVIDKIGNFQNRYKALKTWVSLANIHLTLQFLGWVDIHALNDISLQVQQIVYRTFSFQVSYESIGLFPHAKKPRILWIGVSEGVKDLLNIVKELSNANRRFVLPEKKIYVPHMTVARLKNASENDISDIMDEYKNAYFGKDVVQDIVLMKSTLHHKGSVYCVLERFKLKKN